MRSTLFNGLFAGFDVALATGQSSMSLWKQVFTSPNEAGLDQTVGIFNGQVTNDWNSLARLSLFALWKQTSAMPLCLVLIYQLDHGLWVVFRQQRQSHALQYLWHLTSEYFVSAEHKFRLVQQNIRRPQFTYRKQKTAFLISQCPAHGSLFGAATGTPRSQWLTTPTEMTMWWNPQLWNEIVDFLMMFDVWWFTTI